MCQVEPTHPGFNTPPFIGRWFFISAMSYYFLNPLYGENISKAAHFTADWMLFGLARNLGLTVIYYEFWYMRSLCPTSCAQLAAEASCHRSPDEVIRYHTLYRMKLADRKFKPSYPSDRVIWRNRFWTCMGAVQW